MAELTQNIDGPSVRADAPAHPSAPVAEQSHFDSVRIGVAAVGLRPRQVVDPFRGSPCWNATADRLAHTKVIREPTSDDGVQDEGLHAVLMAAVTSEIQELGEEGGTEPRKAAATEVPDRLVCSDQLLLLDVLPRVTGLELRAAGPVARRPEV